MADVCVVRHAARTETDLRYVSAEGTRVHAHLQRFVSPPTSPSSAASRRGARGGSKSPASAGASSSSSPSPAAGDRAPAAEYVRDELAHVDRYGFAVIDELPRDRRVSSESPSPKKRKRDARREAKWLIMAQDMRTWRGKDVFHRRALKGVPDAMRGFVWPRMVQATDWLAAHPTLFRSLVDQSAGETPHARSIAVDLDRTFPDHVLFRLRDGAGQRALGRVLHALSLFNSRMGYCQGMGFCTALLLMYTDEEMAFGVLAALTSSWGANLAGLWEEGFPLMRELAAIVVRLARKTLPRLAAVLGELEPMLYFPGWLMTLFVNCNLPFETTLRIWDAIMLEGELAVVRASLAILKCSAPALLAADPDEALSAVSCLKDASCVPADADAFMDVYRSVRVTSKTVARVRAELRSPEAAQA